MKEEKIFTEIGMISDEIIDEAETDRFIYKPEKHIIHRWAPVAAACLVIILAATIFAVKQGNNTPDEFNGLPMLSVGEASKMNAAGFEGYLAYDINELKNGNPWSNSDNIKTLPVFRNPVSYNESYIPVDGLPVEEMITRAKKTAAQMGLTIDSVYTDPTEEYLAKVLEKTGSAGEATPTKAIALCGNVRIEVEAYGLLSVFFEPGAKLPDEYSFPIEEDYYIAERITRDPATGEEISEREEKLPSEGYTQDYASGMDDAYRRLSYLLDAYGFIVNMKNPAMDLFGNYDIFGRLFILHRAYEGQGDIVERILGYNFDWVTFGANDNGELMVARRFKQDLTQKVGDYPIITAEKARDLLLQKRYMTSVPEELPGEDYIVSVELVYRTERYNELFMPYTALWWSCLQCRGKTG